MKLILSNLTQNFKAFRFAHSAFDQLGVMGFQIGEDSQLCDRSIVSDIALLCKLRIGIAPLPCRTSKQNDVEQICLICVGEPFGILGVAALRQYIIFDCICVNEVIAFGEETLSIPL